MKEMNNGRTSNRDSGNELKKNNLVQDKNNIRSGNKDWAKATSKYFDEGKNYIL